MTAVPREVARKHPANQTARRRRRSSRVIDGQAWERVGLITGAGMAQLLIFLFGAALLAGLLLSLTHA